MNYVIITGASKGLGAAITEELLDRSHHLLCIARSTNFSLLKEAEARGVSVEFINYDLSDMDNLEQLSHDVFSKVDRERAESIHLIDNAGLLDPMKPLVRSTPQEITKNFQVNLISPAVLTSLFMKVFENMEVEKRVINISSGAGKHPIYGWGCYGSSKAGIDLMSQTAALEQGEQEFPVKVVSFAPGVIDTGMQEQIRETDKEDFIDVEKFVEYKEEEKLLSPTTVAKVVAKLLKTEEFPNGQVTSVKELL